MPSIAPSAWGILQAQSCLKFSIDFAVSNWEIENFINWGDVLNIYVQISQLIAVDFPIANIVETVRKYFPVDRSYKATMTRFSMGINSSVEYHVFLQRSRRLLFSLTTGQVFRGISKQLNKLLKKKHIFLLKKAISSDFM